jgi:hypothetical protein
VPLESLLPVACWPAALPQHCCSNCCCDQIHSADQQLTMRLGSRIRLNL